MFSLCIRYAGSRERAKDILQDGFITVFEKIGSYNGTGSFEGWMRRIFVNTALMAARKADVLKYSGELEDHHSEMMSDEDVMDSINSTELLRIISSMPHGLRIVFNMHVIEGYNHSEISERLGITEGSCRSRLSRARTWLQEAIRRKEGEE
jgi:RNA polymerase sigma-70 factor (ECF subfamily)